MKECTDAADNALRDGTEANVVANGQAVRDAGEAEVAVLLGSWHSAAERLEEAHRAACDEISRLRQDLAARNAELAHPHRLSDFGDLVARTAHEMRDGLETVRQQVDLLRRRFVNDPSGSNLADKLVANLAACDLAVHDLISFASQRQPETDVLSVRDLVDGARTALARQLSQRAVHVVVDVPEETRTTGDQELLRRAIINVVLQALDQVPRGGELLVAAAEGNEVTEVEIACGSPPAIRGTPAVPPTDQAAGVLRWAVVHHILQQHGGQAMAKQDEQGGKTYVLRIPHPRRS